jgi:class 3 adenylate cyclase
MDAEDANTALGSVVGALVKAVTRFGGVVNRQMGDGVMALFGAPVATGTMRRAPALPPWRRSMPSLSWARPPCPIRIGICSGPVILRKTGRDEADYDVAGITAHIARPAGAAGRARHHPAGAPDRKLVTGIASIESDGRGGAEGPSPSRCRPSAS